jgi:ankyrin repeat protein
LNEAFIKAAENGDIPLMKDLLAQGANINYADTDGNYTALCVAAASGNVGLVQFLLGKGAKVEGSEIYPNQPIYFAITENHPIIVDILINAGVDTNYSWAGKHGGTLLTNAAQFGYLEIVKILIRHGANINYTGNGDYTAIYRAIIYEHLDVVFYLINNGAKLNDKDISSLSQLDWFNESINQRIISLMKEKGVL